MRKAFISYARANKPDVDQLVEHLRQLGCDTWVDSSLHGGQDWWQEILRRIAECDVFIAVISDDALNSVACSREFDWAEALRKPVMPVAMETLPASALPGRYSRRQIIDYSNRTERDRAAVRLGGGLISLPQAPPMPRPSPQPPPAPLSYLTDLVDMVASPRRLNHDQQAYVLDRLRPALRSLDPEERQSGRAILDRFGSRADLYPDIDTSLARMAHVPTSAPPPQPAVPAEPRFPQTRLGGPAMLLGVAALAGVIPPIVASASHHGDYPFAVWYLQTFSWLLIGTAFGVLGSRAASVKGAWAVPAAWLMAPVAVLYVVNDLVWVTMRVLGKQDANPTLFDLLSGLAYPALLGLMALLATAFAVGVLAIKPVPWTVALTLWGLLGIVQAYLAYGAKKGLASDWERADTALIVLYVSLFAVAVLMTTGSRKR